jgi:hypothetical protein
MLASYSSKNGESHKQRFGNPLLDSNQHDDALAQRTGQVKLFDEALAHNSNAAEVFTIAAPYFAEMLERDKAITLRLRSEALAKTVAGK